MKHRRWRPTIIPGGLPSDMPKYLTLTIVEWHDDRPDEEGHACTEACLPPDPHLLDPEPYAMGPEA